MTGGQLYLKSLHNEYSTLVEQRTKLLAQVRSNLGLYVWSLEERQNLVQEARELEADIADFQESADRYAAALERSLNEDRVIA